MILSSKSIAREKVTPSINASRLRKCQHVEATVACSYSSNRDASRIMNGVLWSCLLSATAWNRVQVLCKLSAYMW